MLDFIRLSRYAGMREDLVQAGGGNSSVKIDGGRMLVKSSGFQLADLTLETGYSTIDYGAITRFFRSCKNLASLTDSDGKALLAETTIAGGRPSIETFLHAITNTFTLHTHPVVVNVLTAHRQAQQLIAELFPEAVFVNYATPGIALAKAYFKVVGNALHVGSQIIFLQNHGLVVSAATADEVIALTEQVVKRIEAHLQATAVMAHYHEVTRLWQLRPEKIVWRVTDENVLNVYRRQGLWNHVFCPDCVVFLGKKIWSPTDLNAETLATFMQNFGEPVVVEWGNTLYIYAQSVRKALEIQSVLSFSAQVRTSLSDADCQLLDDSEQNFLLNWDAEKYRKKL